ncbi:hypothetical protein Tco_0328861 [Tanacetum coccineum]
MNLQLNQKDSNYLIYSNCVVCFETFWIHKDGDGDALFQLKTNSLPHAHAQTTKTYYKHQDSRIMKAQELKTKTSAQTLIYKIFPQRYQVYQGRLLASFQDDAKYEHVGQDTRSRANGNLRELSGKEAWEAIENFAQGQKEWDNPPNIISEQELANLKIQAKRLFGNEKVWVKMHGEEVEETIGIPMELEPLDETQLKDLGLNTCNHDIPLNNREVSSFDEPEPQPNPLPNCPSLDAPNHPSNDIVQIMIEDDLRIGVADAKTRIAFDDDFLGPPLSYTLIEEPLRRLCHRLIGFISLEELGIHFGVITKQSLQTLTIEVRDLPTIDPDELMRLRICERVIDTVAWVAKGPPMQQFGAASGDAQIDPEMPQAATAAPRTIAHRLQIVEDEFDFLLKDRLKGVMLAVSLTNIYGVDIPGISIFVYDVSISRNVRSIS